MYESFSCLVMFIYVLLSSLVDLIARVFSALCFVYVSLSVMCVCALCMFCMWVIFYALMCVCACCLRVDLCPMVPQTVWL